MVVNLTLVQTATFGSSMLGTKLAVGLHHKFPGRAYIYLEYASFLQQAEFIKLLWPSCYACVTYSYLKFLKNLSPIARTWLSKFFSRIMATHSLPKMEKRQGDSRLKKPGKDLRLAANYHPMSLLSVCYKLLERLALQRISTTVEALLSPVQTSFRKVEALVTWLPASPLLSRMDFSRT